MIAHVHFVSFSPCGGTEKVAKALARDIPTPHRAHNITLPENRTSTLHFSDGDLVFLAFPVYGGRMPRRHAAILSCLRGNGTPAVMVAVYGNRAYEGAFLDMQAAIRANGFVPVAAIAAVAEHSGSPAVAAGRPDADDAETLARFGVRALEQAQAGRELVDIPGAYPEWRLPPGTDLALHTDLDACTRCGICAGVCPTAAIPASAPQDTVMDACIACSACVRRCPQNARRIGNAETKREFSSHLLHAVERREPELFI